MKKIVIIPAYNEQGSILNTIEDIRKNNKRKKKSYVNKNIQNILKKKDKL